MLDLLSQKSRVPFRDFARQPEREGLEVEKGRVKTAAPR